ncbi:MAG: ABC transporter ATP-binding protein [Planctomycetes bacterium]|nr:ABC transporter ATP-binding protein [Planctomycetota bacterium]
MNAPLLELKQVGKIYPQGEDQLQVLDNINLSLQTGEAIAISGPSGSGKSTLLNIASGLDVASSGQVIFQGSDLSHYDDEKLASFRLNQIGFIFQSHHLLQQCSALENILMPTIPLKNSNNSARALELLEIVGLKDRSNHFPAQLSGGECQRVAIARALINAPKILFADEPTGSLDSKRSMEMLQLLLSLKQSQDTSIVLVTHSDECAKHMDKTYTLELGRLQS